MIRRLRRTALLVVAIGTAASGLVGYGAEHASAQSRAAAAASGYYVAGHGRVSSATDGAQIMDPRGGEHVVLVRSGHFQYMTRAPGARHWVSRRVPGHIMPGSFPWLAPLISVNGKRVMFFYVLHGFHFLSAPIGATTLSRKADVGNCPGDAELGGTLDNGVVALPHGRIATLTYDHGPGVCTGRPGGKMTLAALPAPNHIDLDVTPIGVTSIARDANTGQVTVIGTGGSGVSGIWAWTAPNAHGWKALGRVSHLPTVSHTNFVVVTSETVAHGRTWVALDHYLVTDARRTTTPLLLHSRARGHWGASEELPNGTSSDSDVQLVSNPRTGAVHAVFVHDSTTQHGIRHEYFSHGAWSRPKYLAHGTVSLPVSASLSPAGHPAVGFVRR